MSTEQRPDHKDFRRRVRQAWGTYQQAEQARAEASAAVTAELAAARAGGVTMYRMAKWLKVTQRAIQLRLEHYDQTAIGDPPRGRPNRKR